MPSEKVWQSDRNTPALLITTCAAEPSCLASNDFGAFRSEGGAVEEGDLVGRGEPSRLALGWPWRSSLRCRRSRWRGESPPQFLKRSSLASAYSRQASFTGQCIMHSCLLASLSADSSEKSLAVSLQTTWSNRRVDCERD